jgi:hypothetical protein
MSHEYDGIEKQFLIRDAEMESRHYEEKAERCLARIFDGSWQAYVLALHFSARADAYQSMIKELKLPDARVAQK